MVVTVPYSELEKPARYDYRKSFLSKPPRITYEHEVRREKMDKKEKCKEVFF